MNLDRAARESRGGTRAQAGRRVEHMIRAPARQDENDRSPLRVKPSRAVCKFLHLDSVGGCPHDELAITSDSSSSSAKFVVCGNHVWDGFDRIQIHLARLRGRVLELWTNIGEPLREGDSCGQIQV